MYSPDVVKQHEAAGARVTVMVAANDSWPFSVPPRSLTVRVTGTTELRYWWRGCAREMSSLERRAAQSNPD